MNSYKLRMFEKGDVWTREEVAYGTQTKEVNSIC
jgi:hypothetical protein